MTPSDVDIIMAYQRGKQAEKEILQRYHRYIWKEVHYYQKTAHQRWDNDDLYQIASIALLKSAASWKPELNPSFLSYASCILRRELRKLEPPRISVQSYDDLSGIPAPETSDSTQEFWHAWHQASSSLTLLERIVLSLKLALDGGRKVSFRKIAQDLKLTSEQVRNTYYRGLVKLRRRLRNLLE